MKHILTLLIFTLLACSENPCEDVNCNNGSCIEGICDCEEGFSGVNCDQLLDPSRVRIVQITIEGYPTVNTNGVMWDEFDNSALDLIYQIDQGSMTSGIRGIVRENSDILPIVWNENVFLEPEAKYFFYLFDVDEDLETEMVSFEFPSYNGVREENISYNNGQYNIIFEIEYDFN